MNRVGSTIFLSLLFVVVCGTCMAATSDTPIEKSAEAQKVEKEMGYLQIKFKDPFWSVNLLRRLGYAPSGGADIGECLFIAEQINLKTAVKE